MKHSHIQTPRTLAECSFTTGYRLVPLRRRFNLADALWAVAWFLSMAGLGVLMAWRM